MNQLPVLALVISSSSAENRQIVAERRTPPASTASAACIAISYTSIGRRRSAPAKIRDCTRCSILSSALRSGSGPGALKPPEIIEPFGRICVKSKYTRRPSKSGNCPPPSKNVDNNTPSASAQPSMESSITQPFACFLRSAMFGILSTWCFCTEKPAPAPHNRT